MFYVELTETLREDTNLVATVTTYSGYPAIFANEAPEDAEKPYIVFRIESSPLTDKVVSVSNVFIDYYDFGKSRAEADSAALAIEDLLDSNKLRTEQITDLRFALTNTGYVTGTDPRTINHVTTLSARGARSGWMKRTK